MSHRLQMVWVATDFVPTQVVEFESMRNFSDEKKVREPMSGRSQVVRLGRLRPDSVSTVALRVDIGGPIPTAGLGVNLNIPTESNRESVVEDHSMIVLPRYDKGA